MKTTQTARAYAELRKAILEGTLQSGYPLLETELAARLGMSRTPVRAAILRLQVEGLLEVLPRKGVLVRPVSPADVEQIYEMLEALEGMAVKAAASRATPEEIQQLVKTAREMYDAANSGKLEAIVQADIEFHRLLRQMAHNHFITQELERFDSYVERVRWLRGRGNAAAYERSAAEHRATAEAIQAGEGERARLLHQAHWQRVRQEAMELLGQAEKGGLNWLPSRNGQAAQARAQVGA
ncbi:GntR family transcriptional regulator [Carboxydochorda subterranea]|uniref:GntR family transcriptional regulator n=1 Tax=Carboxydichorda subterranea TaxID=3109565 RepID=A0ABZ1C0Y0_9FIRM|nr:GntR family transcriptional regulator [Limnochorda sp. L945t]WRP18732.1 GntR family transcriptional regulator [Limnochorda sp. L945t]